MKTKWKNTIIIPCLNEEESIRRVVEEVRLHSPESHIVVVDNGSTDSTREIALGLGVEVMLCRQPGKGRAVQYALSRIHSNSFTLVDGDGTYDLSRLKEFILSIQNGEDMVVGQRLTYSASGSFPRYHVFGNRFFSQLVSWLFGVNTTDILSGFRVMSEEFVRSCPLTVEGFEMEAFYTLEAAVKGFSVKEIPILYRARRQGSESKLRTFRDGFKILACILNLFRTYKPMPVALTLTVLTFALSLWSGSLPVFEFLQYSYVYAVPRAVLAAALMILSFSTFSVGLILSIQIRNQLQLVSINRQKFQRPPQQDKDQKAA